MTGSQVDLTAIGSRRCCQGQIVSLEGQQFVARVTDAAGTALNLRADLNIDNQAADGRPAGSLATRAGA